MKQDLWCVHILGPDDLIPAPDFETAERWAGKANRLFEATRKPDPHWPIMKAEVTLWTYSLEGHAEGVSDEYRWITE